MKADSTSSSFLLVANPGSASRKYALYQGDTKVLDVHFELADKTVVYSVNGGEPRPAGISHVAFAASHLPAVIKDNLEASAPKDIDGDADTSDEATPNIAVVAVRVVAPSTYYQQHRRLDKAAIQKLKDLETIAPLHISATLQEIQLLERFLPASKLVGISDSAFHATLTEPARSYGIPGDVAKQLDIKRFGYHGLSVQSVVRLLSQYHSLPERLIVCHLGSGASVTAVKHGSSFDTTMGYSPLEGLLMATRSGNLDPTAALVLQAELKLSPVQLQEYLNHSSGLLGVSGISDDIRELLAKEETHPSAKLALDMYVYRVRQAIGQMAAAMGGLDALIFTGTVGERSVIMRKRIGQKLNFLGIEIASPAHKNAVGIQQITKISPSGSPVSVYVVPTDEMTMMAKLAEEL